MDTGGDDQHAAAVVRCYAEEVESHLDGSHEHRGFLEIMLEALRVSFECEFHILASKKPAAPSEQPEMIHTNISDDDLLCAEQRRLPTLFEDTMRTEDHTWGRDVTSQDSHSVLSAAKVIQLRFGGRPDEKLTLLLAVCDRRTPPDRDFVTAQFRTSDQFMLRIALLHVAIYIRDEHSERKREFDQSVGFPRLPVRLTAAKRLLEFERLIGLGTDPKVFACWLEAEKDAFDTGEARTGDFRESLKSAKKWLDDGAIGEAERSLRNLLFQCHLLDLTKTGKIPLLSQRRLEARRLAGLD